MHRIVIQKYQELSKTIRLHTFPISGAKLVHRSENRMCAGVLQVAWRLQKAKMKHQNTCLCFMLPLLFASFSVDGQQKKMVILFSSSS